VRRLLLAAASPAVVLWFATGACAQGKIEVGTLTCSGGEGIGLILGSKKAYECTFAPSGGGRREAYSASVTKVGLDIGFTGKTVMVWTVLAAAQTLAPRALAGTYAGVVADASVGVGGGGKVLVGGSQESIALQPVSVQGQTGLNLAVGVGEMTLR